MWQHTVLNRFLLETSRVYCTNFRIPFKPESRCYDSFAFISLY